MKCLWLLAAAVGLVFAASCGGSSYADLEAARQAGRAEALAEQLEAMRERESRRSETNTGERRSAPHTDERRGEPDTDERRSDATGGRASRERTDANSAFDPMADADANFEAAKIAEETYEQTGCYGDDFRPSDWLLICGALRSELNRALADTYEQLAVLAIGEGCHSLAGWFRDAIAIYRADAADLDLARATQHDVATQRNALDAYTSRALPDYDELDRLSTNCFSSSSDNSQA